MLRDLISHHVKEIHVSFIWICSQFEPAPPIGSCPTPPLSFPMIGGSSFYVILLYRLLDPRGSTQHRTRSPIRAFDSAASKNITRIKFVKVIDPVARKHALASNRRDLSAYPAPADRAPNWPPPLPPPVESSATISHVVISSSPPIDLSSL